LVVASYRQNHNMMFAASKGAPTRVTAINGRAIEFRWRTNVCVRHRVQGKRSC